MEKSLKMGHSRSRPSGTAVPEDLPRRLRGLLDWLGSGLIERETPVRLALLAMLAGEHLLLLGPPGTAKSELARRLQGILADGHCFERLLTRFSVPEELFGPLSIQALEEDRYERLTEGYLPQASVAFIDEVFKASSAILNTLLTLLNERVFDNGHRREPVPLACVIAASNELPEEDELEALYDRFLLRHAVAPLSEHGFRQLLTLDDTAPAECPAEPLTADTLEKIRDAAREVRLNEETLELLVELRRALAAAGIHASDRRWRKAVHLLRVAVHCEGRDEVMPWDCRLLRHCLWHEPGQQAQVDEILDRLLGLSPEGEAGAGIRRLERLVATWHDTLEQERHRTRPRTNAQGEPLYLDAQGNTTTEPREAVPGMRDGELLYLAPPGQPDRSNGGAGYTREELARHFFDDHFRQTHIGGRWVSLDDYLADPDNRLQTQRENRPLTEPWGWSETHVRARQRELDELRQTLREQRERLVAQRDRLDERDISLWHDDEWLDHVARALEQDLGRLEELIDQIDALHEAFGRLPREHTATDSRA